MHAEFHNGRRISAHDRHWKGILWTNQEVLSKDRLQEINSASALMYPAPEGGKVRGLARSFGRIEYLLASPNMYPVGKGSHEVRSCVQCYDLLPATVNHNGEAITNGHLVTSEKWQFGSSG
jgi:hypothetical protein